MKIELKRIVVIISLFFMISPLVLLGAGLPVMRQEEPDAYLEKTFKVNKRYILFPYCYDSPDTKVQIVMPKETAVTTMRLNFSKIDYWAFWDLDLVQGKKVTVRVEDTPSNRKVMDMIVLSDELRLDNPYHEAERQQIHFSPLVGWMNDPNGLFYADGLYHFYYQAKPFATKISGHQYWGHAVSRDLIHWEQRPAALYTNADGFAFSGSCLVDFDNLSGFQKGKNPPVIAAYTRVRPDVAEQMIAYSDDGGNSFTDYDAVLPTRQKFGKGERDPKIFRYEEGGWFVMVLYEGDGNSIYTSEDLKAWEFQCHIPGFYECPEFFELPVEGQPETKKWVMLGGNGNYMIGTFDGKEFTAETKLLRYNYGDLYAAQTFNHVPDGRRIQIGWGRGDFRAFQKSDKMFFQSATFPGVFTLRATDEGLRLCLNPISEISVLYDRSYQLENTVLGEAKVKEMLNSIKSDQLHIKLDLEVPSYSSMEFSINGYPISYGDPMVANTQKYHISDPVAENLKLEIIVDRTSIEIFLNGGMKYSFINYKAGPADWGLNLNGNKQLKINNLEIHTLKSIWN